MHRILLKVAYDGTNYCGWQVQPNGTSIQQVLQAAVEDLVGEKVNLTGASRTDSGVHALCQIAVFDTNKEIEPWKYAYALNQRLPKDIVVRESKEVAADFHPRYRNVVKTYEYKVLNDRMPRPCDRLYTHFVPVKLDLEAMKAAAAYLAGEHDFRSFCSQKSDAVSTVRTIYSIALTEGDNIITLRISGNGFLYNMVRIIAGTLLKVGCGQKTPEYVREALEFPQEKAAGPTAPARGLTLIDISYPDDEGQPVNNNS
ncbi:MAG: tRNA pseudouridine(38-40) synthase TruA [Lachnospiraceae bacterium]|nr:tRNA pseudouridine(38-40) synthase TruA [Lachnospiraceae bacterium]